jgi:Di-haem oxidoreductase, putative peroxidase
MHPNRPGVRKLLLVASLGLVASLVWLRPIKAADVGREVAIPHHLQDGDEFHTSLRALLRHGQRLLDAVWTIQEGGGRPLTKGTGAPLADGADPLTFPRDFNRVSAPDSNACSGCHNKPFGLSGGGGDIVANVFVLGQRFDFLTFDPNDTTPTRGAVDEAGNFVTLQGAANSRATLGMFGSGYIEMLARQITADLQDLRDATPPGGSKPLQSKGISYGTIARGGDGSWDTSGVEGIAAPSLVTSGPADPPSLIIRPFHQAGNVVSLRQFTNNAFNHHHGIQSTERFGIGTDPDGDGFVNELTRADVTAVSVFQATMAVPGRVIPSDPELEAAVWRGEQRFKDVGCASCHVPRLPLDKHGWVFTEPNPYNPPGNLRPGDAPTLRVDLSRPDLPSPRLRPRNGVVWVPAFTDLKLHDITSGPGDPNREVLDMNQPAGSPGFFAGNGKFLTRKLWGSANEPPYFHHGQYTTLRQAVLAHAGEAEASAQAYGALSGADQDAVIEFLKSLQVLPPGTRSLVVDDRGRPRRWH